MRIFGSACALLAACMVPAASSPAVATAGSFGPRPAGYRISLPPLSRIPGPAPSGARGMKMEAVLRAPALKTRKPEAARGAARTEPVTRISGYVYCGSSVASAQRCIDAGKLTLYYPAGVRTLAGHNYMGWSWMDDLPVGREVVIGSGVLAGTYRVYAHGWAQRGSRGGTFPSAGLGASVALQTCTSTGTGFSFLRRIASR